MDRIYQNRVAKNTDYLLISEPSINLGVIPVSKGATFQFKVKNCSHQTYFPYIVSAFVNTQSDRLNSNTQGMSVKLTWQRTEVVEESEINFPDVLDCLNSMKFKVWQRQQQLAEEGFPSDYDAMKDKYKTKQILSQRYEKEEAEERHREWIEPI